MSDTQERYDQKQLGDAIVRTGERAKLNPADLERTAGGLVGSAEDLGHDLVRGWEAGPA